MTIKKFLLLVLVFGIIMSIGCSAKYTSPTPDYLTNKKEKYVEVVNAPYEKVYSYLVEYAEKKDFTTDYYNKKSGWITLSFNSSNPERLITGGEWEYKDSRPSIQMDFKGDYVKFASKYHIVQLNGKCHIVGTKISEDKTKISVRTRYFLKIEKANKTVRWSFETGNCDTVKIPFGTIGTTRKARIICPTHKLENDILNAVANEFE